MTMSIPPSFSLYLMSRKPKPAKVEQNEPMFHQVRPTKVEEVNVFKIPVSQQRPFIIPGTDLGVSQSSGNFDSATKMDRFQDLLLQVQKQIDNIKDSMKQQNEAQKEFKFSDDEQLSEDVVDKLTHKQKLKLLDQLLTVRKTIRTSLDKEDAKNRDQLEKLQKQVNQFQKTSDWMEKLASQNQLRSTIQPTNITQTKKPAYDEIYQQQYGPPNNQSVKDIETQDLNQRSDDKQIPYDENQQQYLMGNRNPIKSNTDFASHLPYQADDKQLLVDRIINVIDTQKSAKIDEMNIVGNSKIRQLEHCNRMRANGDCNDKFEMYQTQHQNLAISNNLHDDGTRASLVNSRLHDTQNRQFQQNYSIHQNDIQARKRSLDEQINESNRRMQNSQTQTGSQSKAIVQSKFQQQLNNITDPHAGQIPVTRDQYGEQIRKSSAFREQNVEEKRAFKQQHPDACLTSSQIKNQQLQSAINRYKDQQQNSVQKNTFDEETIDAIYQRWKKQRGQDVYESQHAAQNQFQAQQQTQSNIYDNNFQGFQSVTRNAEDKMVQSGRADNTEIQEYIRASRVSQSKVNESTTNIAKVDEEMQLSQNQQNAAQRKVDNIQQQGQDQELALDSKIQSCQPQNDNKEISLSQGKDQEQTTIQNAQRESIPTKLPVVLNPFLQSNLNQITQMRTNTAQLHQTILKSTEENYSKVFKVISENILAELIQQISLEYVNLFLQDFK